MKKVGARLDEYGKWCRTDSSKTFPLLFLLKQSCIMEKIFPIDGHIVAAGCINVLLVSLGFKNNNPITYTKLSFFCHIFKEWLVVMIPLPLHLAP